MIRHESSSRAQRILLLSKHKVLPMRETVLDSVTSIIEYRSLESGQHVRRIRMYSSVQLEYMLKNGICPEIIDIACINSDDGNGYHYRKSACPLSQHVPPVL